MRPSLVAAIEHRRHKLLMSAEAPDASQSTFTYSAFANAANGATSTTLTFTAKDADGVVIPSVPLTWTQQRITLSAADSYLSVVPTDIASNGVASSTITAQLQHLSGSTYIGMRGIPGASVVLAVTGTGNTITQPSAITDRNGETTGSVVSTQAGATKTVSQTAVGLAMTDTATLTTDAGVPSPFFEETWNYTDTANMAADPNNWFDADTRTHPSDTTITLTTGLTTPWGGTKACRGTFSDMTAYSCGTEPELGKNILIPGASSSTLREMWLEFYLRFSSNWEVTFSCLSYDHKTMFITQKRKEPEGLNYRWRFSTGNGPNKAGTQPMVFNDPNSGVNRWLRDPAGAPTEASDISSRAALWDETWHLCRAYVKMSSSHGATDGAFKFWINSTLAVNVSNYVSAGDAVGGSRPVVDEFFQRLALGRNMNERPEQSQWFEYGRIRIYNTDPSW